MGKILLALAVSGSAFFTVSYDFAGTGNLDSAKFTEIHCYNGTTSCTNGITAVAGIGKVASTFDSTVWKVVGTYPTDHFMQVDATYSTVNTGGVLNCVRLKTRSAPDNTSGYCTNPTSAWSTTDITLHKCTGLVMTGNTDLSCGYVTQVSCTGGFADATSYTIKLEIAGTTAKISKGGVQCGSDITTGLTDYTDGVPGIIGYGGGSDPALNPVDNAVWTDATASGIPAAIINAFLKGGGWLLRHP